MKITIEHNLFTLTTQRFDIAYWALDKIHFEESKSEKKAADIDKALKHEIPEPIENIQEPKPNVDPIFTPVEPSPRPVIESVEREHIKTPIETETDRILENAYMGEHPNIQPEETPRKKLSKTEQKFWDYIQENPDYTMPKTCRELGISNSMFYFLKQQLKKKGWPVNGVVDCL